MWSLFFFFFNDTATTEIYTLSLHDALPIFELRRHLAPLERHRHGGAGQGPHAIRRDQQAPVRSEEHTSELQSRLHLVCRLLLEKKKIKHINIYLPQLHTDMHDTRQRNHCSH